MGFHITKNGHLIRCLNKLSEAPVNDCSFKGKHFQTVVQAQDAFRKIFGDNSAHHEDDYVETVQRRILEATLPSNVTLEVTELGLLALQAPYAHNAHWKTFNGLWSPNDKLWKFPLNMMDEVLEEVDRLYGLAGEADLHTEELIFAASLPEEVKLTVVDKRLTLVWQDAPERFEQLAKSMEGHAEVMWSFPLIKCRELLYHLRN